MENLINKLVEALNNVIDFISDDIDESRRILLNFRFEDLRIKEQDWFIEWSKTSNLISKLFFYLFCAAFLIVLNVGNRLTWLWATPVTPIFHLFRLNARVNNSGQGWWSRGYQIES